MSGLIYYTDKRRVLPLLERTSTYNDTKNLGVLNSKSQKTNWMRPIINLKEENLNEKLNEWRKSKNYNLAGDILSQAINSENIAEIKEVKEYLLKKYPNDYILNWLFQNGQKEVSIKEKITHNYKKLLLEPKDAVTWTDQAINFISTNDRDEAIKCAEEAIKINGDLGFIVRNASRIFSLIGDNNRSIKLLKNSKYYKYDPQIISAEIAFSQMENRKTTGIEIADKLITNNQYAYNEKSELASTLGTIEFFKENFKKSEQLFDLSLLAPNKNSFAQSLWYKKEIITPQQFQYYSDSNEIQTHKNSKESNFAKALEYALYWKNDEPYSARPYRVSSHISGVLLGDNVKASELILQGLESQKTIKGDNFTKKEELEFNNDLAYYLLKSNRIDEAEAYILSSLELQNKSSKLEDSEYIRLATLGLFFYKKGEKELGHKLYRKTISHFLTIGKTYMASSAFLNFFDEEIITLSDIDALTKLRRELDDIVKEDSQNELLFRKKRSLELFKKKMSQKRI